MIPKYRVFVKADGEQFIEDVMLDVDIIDFGLKVVGVRYERDYLEFGFDEVILMQSTGLTDTNGVEIFEGDLLIYEANIFTVEWIRLGFIPVRKSEFGYERLSSYLMTEAIRIGNIHQNPELLEA